MVRHQTVGARGPTPSAGVAALVVVGPLATVGAAMLASRQSPLPFVVALVLLGGALTWLIRIVWSDRREQRAPVAMDVALTLALGVVSAATLALLLWLARDYGIRGSAAPRVLQGIPLPADYPYLISVGVAAAIILTVVVRCVLLLRRLPAVRSASARAEATADSAADVLTSALAVPATPRATAAVTSSDDSFWRRLMSPGAWVLFVVCAILSIPGLWVVASDYDNDLGVLGFPAFFMAAPVTAWACLESLWRRDRELGVLFPAIGRSIVVAVVTALPIGVLDLLVIQLPAFTERVRSFQRPDEVYEGHYWFPLDGPSVLQSVGWDLTLGGVAIAGVAGLFTAVFVVLPVTAFRDPDQFIREQGLSRAPEHRVRNAAVVRVLALGLPLAFVVPALLVNSRPDDTKRWVGVALAVVGVVAGYYVWRNQRIDYATRVTRGEPLGVLNPEDRERMERELGRRDP